jgi:hypothetical protein
MSEKIDLVGKTATCKIQGVDCTGIVLEDPIDQGNTAVFLNNEYGWSQKDQPDYAYGWFIPRYWNVNDLADLDVTDFTILD